MSQPDTKQRILDAAERLFATEGFHATSLRTITREAKVNLAAVNYHFGSKEALLEMVMGRRLGPLNEVRQARIGEVERQAADNDGKPDLRALWTAFVEPTLELRCPESGAEYFLSLIGQMLADPSGILMRVFLKQMSPLLQRLFELTCRAMPDIPRQTVYWRVHFAIGSLSHLMRRNDQAPITPPDIDDDVDVKIMTGLLLDYTLAGLEAPV